MNNILIPLESHNSSEILYPTPDDCGSMGVWYCNILNHMEVLQAGHSRARPRQRPFPIAQLEVTAESFDADYFSWQGCQFVSERLRDAMALDPTEVRYFDIDDSPSVAATRSKLFKIMEPLAVEDVSDRSRTRYEMASLLPGDPEQPRIYSDVAVREDARPKHPLFFGGMYCTEAFALRVLRAGCTGLNFVYPDRRSSDPHYRTLRGIEQYVGWDPIEKVEITTLVEAIP